MAGEVAPGHGLQWGVAPVNLQSVSAAGRVECGGWRVLSRARSLSLSYCIAGAAPFWADFRNRSALWHTTQIPGEVSLGKLNLFKRLKNITGADEKSPGAV
jgi:hypothetical protein